MSLITSNPKHYINTLSHARTPCSFKPHANHNYRPQITQARATSLTSDPTHRSDESSSGTESRNPHLAAGHSALGGPHVPHKGRQHALLCKFRLGPIPPAAIPGCPQPVADFASKLSFFCSQVDRWTGKSCWSPSLSEEDTVNCSPPPSPMAPAAAAPPARPQDDLSLGPPAKVPELKRRP